MAINETISTGNKYRRLKDASTKLWQRLSFWTKASDVEFDNGATAETSLGNIQGITDSVNSNASNIAASAAAVNTLNSNIGVYVGDDGKLHFKNGSGADTALNFKSYSEGYADGYSNAYPELIGVFEASRSYYEAGIPLYRTYTFRKNYNKVFIISNNSTAGTKLLIENNDNAKITTYEPLYESNFDKGTQAHVIINATKGTILQYMTISNNRDESSSSYMGARPWIVLYGIISSES